MSGNKDFMCAVLPPGCGSRKVGTSAGHLIRNREKNDMAGSTDQG